MLQEDDVYCQESELELKKELCESVVISRVTCGVETWDLRMNESYIMGFMKMKCLRNMCGVMRMVRSRNEEGGEELE